MKKKKLMSVLIPMVMVVILSFSFTVQAKPVTLRFACQNPDTGYSSIHCVDPWLKNLEKATQNKVKVQAYYGQTLSKGKDMWSAVKLGITDIGWCFHGYWPGMTPLSDSISLPALSFRTAEKGSEAFWKLYEQFPEIQNEYKDVKVLLLYTSEPYCLITRGKPVKSIEDIKGLKVRMTGGPPTDMMKALGGVPMLIPMPDNYVSLQKGVIDGMGAPWEAINVWRFYEVVEHFTEVPFPAVYFSVVMNKNTWNRLPGDVQDGIMSVGGLEGSKYWGRNFFDQMRAEALKKLEAEGKGDNIYQLSASERQRWIDVGGKPVWARWVKNMESKGYSKARKILDAAVRLSGE